METKSFDQWAIIEIMGHQRYAGRVTEQSVGGCNFVRVDVPPVNDKQPFTKLFGQSSIYCITPVDEETARAAAGEFRQQPLDEWSARRMLGVEGMNKALPFGEEATEDDELCF